MYGESEFWFCSIKVITIIGLIITGIIITAGGGPNHQSIGFRFWNETGGFVQYEGIAGAKGRFLGFFSGSSNMTGELLGLMGHSSYQCRLCFHRYRDHRDRCGGDCQRMSKVRMERHLANTFRTRSLAETCLLLSRAFGSD